MNHRYIMEWTVVIAALPLRNTERQRAVADAGNSAARAAARRAAARAHSYAIHWNFTCHTHPHTHTSTPARYATARSRLIIVLLLIFISREQKHYWNFMHLKNVKFQRYENRVIFNYNLFGTLM